MTERRAKRAQYDAFQKQLRALEKRRKCLWKEAYTYIPLEKPIFVGYEKYFALRADMETRPDVATLEKLLELINSVLFCKNKNFKKRIRRKTKRAHSEKGLKTVSMKHEIQHLDHAKWGKLSRKEQAYFAPREIREKWGGTYIVYEWNYPWMFVSKVRKKFITEVRIPDADKMSESAEIENFIERNYWLPKLCKMVYHCPFNYRNDRMLPKYRLTERQIEREIQQEPPFMISTAEGKEKKVFWSEHCLPNGADP